jgi:hypothetical protein
MTTAAEFRHYAIECIESAREAATDQIRGQFLDLAVLWLKAASRIAELPEMPLHKAGMDGQRPSGSGNGK